MDLCPCPYLFCLSFYLLYFFLLTFEDNGLLFWVPDVFCWHSEVVLWNLLSIQMFFWWICGGESGLPILFLCHLRPAPLRRLSFLSFAIPSSTGQNVVHWRRKWQTTPVFLPQKPHQQYEKTKSNPYTPIHIKICKRRRNTESIPLRPWWPGVMSHPGSLSMPGVEGWSVLGLKKLGRHDSQGACPSQWTWTACCPCISPQSPGPGGPS